jgi:predicted CopG family antitoxin
MRLNVEILLKYKYHILFKRLGHLLDKTKYKPIVISIANYETMKKVGCMGESFNDVLSVLIERAKVEDLLKLKLNREAQKELCVKFTRPAHNFSLEHPDKGVQTKDVKG